MKETRAVSAFALILLVLFSAILGGLISYMWVMASFYLEPETVNVAITEAVFSVERSDRFDVTVMNPSHSPSNAIITKIYFTVEGDNKLYNVTNTEPSLPMLLERGTVKTIRCLERWGQFAGKTVAVHVSVLEGSGATHSVKTEFVKLEAQTYFNATETVNYFNVTVKNNKESAINLTLVKLYFNYLWEIPPENINYENGTIASFPMTLKNGTSVTYRCFYDWSTHVNPAVRISTWEGYYVDVVSNASGATHFLITDISFDEIDQSGLNVTVLNVAESASLIHITGFSLTYNGKTDIINGTSVDPVLPHPLGIGENATFSCAWNWANESRRNVSVVVAAHTMQGFTPSSKTVTTPPEVNVKIVDVEFDLDDTERFLVNLANPWYSLNEISVTSIDFNQSPTIINAATIAVGEEAVFTCSFDWSRFVGEEVGVTVHFVYNGNESFVVYNTTLPRLKIMNVAFSHFAVGTPYVIFTVYNSKFSSVNATITQIIVMAENEVIIVDGTLTSPRISPEGYALSIGKEVTIVCPWNWTQRSGKDITIIVQTDEDFSVSKTLKVE